MNNHWHHWQYRAKNLFILRKTKSSMFRTYKFRLYPSRKQEELMLQHSDLSRWLWNTLLQENKRYFNNFGRFLSKKSLRYIAKRWGLYSQVQQAVADKLFYSLIRYFKLKNKGKAGGFPRFKSARKEIHALYYPQGGFSLINENKLQVTPFGSFTINKQVLIKGKVKTLTFKRTPTNKWFITLVSELPDPIIKSRIQRAVGLDLGLERLATLSDGVVIPNPRHLKQLEERLVIQSRKLSRKMVRSNNFYKQSLRVARVHERIKDARNDYLHKVTTGLVREYSLIALEDLSIQRLQGNSQLARHIADASWSKFTNYLEYKAESAGTTIEFVNPVNTSQECNNCGSIVEKPLSQRIHSCTCGLEIDRDLNAARNILNRGTAGHAGSNARREEQKGSSVMREALLV